MHRDPTKSMDGTEESLLASLPSFTLFPASGNGRLPDPGEKVLSIQLVTFLVPYNGKPSKRAAADLDDARRQRYCLHASTA